MASLRVIEGGKPVEFESLDLRAPRRSGETYRPVIVRASLEFRRNALAVARLGFELDLAFSLAGERALILRQCVASGLDVAIATSSLDNCARDTTAETLPALEASYLRQLLFPAGKKPLIGGRGPWTIAVPARLARQLTSADEVELDPMTVKQAACWEAAAVIQRRTMMEWALGTLLHAVRPGSAQVNRNCRL